jgi:hypothetical protein
VGGLGSGRRRLSLQEHLSRGTFRPDRHGDAARNVLTLPAPPVAPPPPPGLSKTSRERWDRLLREFEGWSASQLTLAEAALRAADRAEACRKVIAREGLTLAGKRGGARRPHPLIRVQRSDERFLVDIFRQLRLNE